MIPKRGGCECCFQSSDLHSSLKYNLKSQHLRYLAILNQVVTECKRAQTHHLDLPKKLMMMSYWCLGRDHSMIGPAALCRTASTLNFPGKRSQRYRHRQ